MDKKGIHPEGPRVAGWHRGANTRGWADVGVFRCGFRGNGIKQQESRKSASRSVAVAEFGIRWSLGTGEERERERERREREREREAACRLG
jgi:hypothetical protein